MLKYILKRLLYMIILFFIMSFLTFMLYNMIPGDPARVEVQAVKNKVSAEVYQQLYEQARERLGLNDPLVVRYLKWFGNILRGNFGDSSVYKQPVKDLIGAPMRNTIFINIFSIFLSLGIAIPIGIRCAVKQNSVFDNTVQVLTIIGYSLPTFIIALVCIFLFAVKLQWFPVSGMNSPNFQGTGMEFFFNRIYHLALPLFIMTIGSLGGIIRYVRAAMIDALHMDYIKTARAKGLKEKVVIYSHAWRNALLPVITIIIGWFLSIFSGSLVIERMFNLNGMGKFYIDALSNQDYNIAVTVQMFYFVIATAGNILIDLSYGLVDPRVRVNK